MHLPSSSAVACYCGVMRACLLVRHKYGTLADGGASSSDLDALYLKIRRLSDATRAPRHRLTDSPGPGGVARDVELPKPTANVDAARRWEWALEVRTLEMEVWSVLRADPARSSSVHIEQLAMREMGAIFDAMCAGEPTSPEDREAIEERVAHLGDVTRQLELAVRDSWIRDGVEYIMDVSHGRTAWRVPSDLVRRAVKPREPKIQLISLNELLPPLARLPVSCAFYPFSKC